MITPLKPYSTFKESGVDWLGSVPDHWEVLPGRTCLQEKKEPNVGLKESTVLSLSYGKIVVKPPEKLHGLVPASFETYQIVDPANIVVRPTDLQNDWHSLRVGICRNRGIITSAYLCFVATERLKPEYCHLLLHSYDLMKVFYGLGSGLRQNLDWADFKYLPCVMPPMPEQTAIAHFLDHMDRQIQKYIRAKEKLIALLDEYKQALIHQAVTGQIDVQTGEPYAEYKESGVEWLGSVPRHWNVSRVKTEFNCLNHRRIPLSSTKRGEMTSRQFDYYGASGVIDRVDDYLFDDELLLLAEDGANLVLRNLPLAIIAKGKFWVNNHAHILKPKLGHLDYLAEVLERLDFGPWISGAAQPKLTQDRLMCIAIAVPPRNEQERIVAFIKSGTSSICLAIDRAHREISLLHEYRTRLIADVVTGKFDVRDAASMLPDVDSIHVCRASNSLNRLDTLGLDQETAVTSSAAR